MNEWKKITIDDVTDVLGDGLHGTPKYTENGEYAFVNGNNLVNGKLIIKKDTKRVDETQYERYKKPLSDRTIMVSINGTLGNVGVYNGEKVILGKSACYFNVKQEYDKDFIKYVVSSPLFKRYLENNSTGTTIKNISLKQMREYEFDVPKALELQRKISSILKKIDDKIEVNEMINRNLQEQALTLFKSYYIDYEPYGGMQPDGWTTVSLDDVCAKITDGSHYSPKDVPGAPYPMYSVKDMETYGFNPSSCKHIEVDELEKMKRSDCVPKKDDILVAKDGSYLKEIFICSEERDEAILSSIAIFRPDTTKIRPEILLYLLKQPSVRKDVGDNYVSGSALPRIVLKDFKKYTFVLPPIREQNRIGEILSAYQSQININVDENHRLTALRDSLLPKLMSGELDVSDIDI